MYTSCQENVTTTRLLDPSGKNWFTVMDLDVADMPLDGISQPVAVGVGSMYLPGGGITGRLAVVNPQSQSVVAQLTLSSGAYSITFAYGVALGRAKDQPIAVVVRPRSRPAG